MIEHVSFTFGCTDVHTGGLPLPQGKLNNSCEALYHCVERDSQDETRVFAILQDKLLDNPSYEFISGLVWEELRRFNQGYDHTEGEELHSRQEKKDIYKLRCSYTVTHFLLNHSVGDHTVGGSWGSEPIISTENYKKIVSIVLDNLPIFVLNRELLEPERYSLKYDSYSPVSLVFQRVLKEMANTRSFFWQEQAMGLLERGASIDYGYIGGKPIFVACACEKDSVAAYTFSHSLMKYLKEPNRVGVCGVAPIHAVISNKLPIDMLEYLLVRGADKEARCTNGIFSVTERTALEIATKLNHIEAVEILLKHNANPNSYSFRPINSPGFSEEERILTPYQTAVLNGNSEMISLFFSHRDRTGVPLCVVLHPREQARYKDFQFHMMNQGGATLAERAQAMQIQIEVNKLNHVFELTGLKAYAAGERTRNALNKALLWIFNNAQHSAAAPMWIPILNAFKNEILINKNFKLTAFYGQNGGCYNNDTQSDIYVHPDYEIGDYQHILSHEIAHLYSFKYQASSSPIAFLSNFRKAMEGDGLLDNASEKYRSLPSELRDLLVGMRNSYPDSQYDHELFPRVCVQFPIMYALLNPGCRESDLLKLMNDIMPQTFSLYRALVMENGRGG